MKGRKNGTIIVDSCNYHGNCTGADRIFAGQQLWTSCIGKVHDRADASLNTSALFEILLHVGTLAAVCVVYFRDVELLIKEGLLLIRDGVLWLVHGGKRKFEMYRDRKMVLLVIVASIPTAILGLVMQKFLEDLFLSSVMAVGFALLLTGGMLLASAKIPAGKKRLEEASYRDAVVIGLFQGVATIPASPGPVPRLWAVCSAALTASLPSGFRF